MAPTGSWLPGYGLLMVKEHNQIVVFVMGLLDLTVTVAAWLLCFYVRFHSGLLPYKETEPPGLSYIDDAVVITLLLTLLVFTRMGMYRPRRAQSMRREVFEVIRACLIVWGAEVVIVHFLHTTRISLMLQSMFLLAWPSLLIAYRSTVRMLLRSIRRHGRNLRSVAIVGAGRLGQKLLHALRRHRWSGYDVRYFVEDRRIGQEFLGVPVHGPVDNIEQVIAANPVDVVFVALPDERHAQLADVLARLSEALVDINVVPDLLSYQFLRHRVDEIGSLPVVNLTHSPQSGFNAAVKRIFDVCFSTLALVALSPLLLLIALVVRLTSRGPVFYIQRRASLGGAEFDMIKFRSMAPSGNGPNADPWAVEKDDPRVTGVGKVLRRLSLDELPQFINVLKGDMSVVGPRPERPEFVERFSRQIPRYVLRHHVKAGITGWAQVNGYRGQTSLQKRIQYDLDYINRWSFGFDMYILLLTVLRGFVNPQH